MKTTSSNRIHPFSSANPSDGLNGYEPLLPEDSNPHWNHEMLIKRGLGQQYIKNSSSYTAWDNDEQISISVPNIKILDGGRPASYPTDETHGYIITLNNIEGQHERIEILNHVRWEGTKYFVAHQFNFVSVRREVFDDGSGPRFTFEKNGEYWVRKPLPQPSP